MPQLSPESRELSSLAAITGRPFDPSIRGELTGQGQTTLLKWISELVAEEVPGGSFSTSPYPLATGR
ncbi:MAG: hypothetical protein C4315_07435 [Chloroflexota bacterium]